MTADRVTAAWGRAEHAIFVVQHRSGGEYLETPEEQGLAEGSFLLRVFTSLEEARRYRDAVEAYVGVELLVSARTLDQLWWPMRSVPDLKIELCDMPAEEWPKTIQTIWKPNQLMQ